MTLIVGLRITEEFNFSFSFSSIIFLKKTVFCFYYIGVALRGGLVCGGVVGIILSS